MEIDFTNQDLIFIYGTFRKEIRKLEDIKNAPNCPFSKKDIDREIKLYSSINDKLKEVNPNLEKMDKYKI